MNPNSETLANFMGTPGRAQFFQGGTRQCQRGAAPLYPALARTLLKYRVSSYGGPCFNSRLVQGGGEGLVEGEEVDVEILMTVDHAWLVDFVCETTVQFACMYFR